MVELLLVSEGLKGNPLEFEGARSGGCFDVCEAALTEITLGG